MSSASELILLLPERRRFAGQALSAPISRLLARADCRVGDAGERAQLLRYFRIRPAGWPMAAISREADAGDAAGHVWLRADPAFARPEMSGVRLMAWGNLALTPAESESFLEHLQPAFSEIGLSIAATAIDRWSVRLPAGWIPPEFSPPTEALGESLLEHLPGGDAGRLWRRLLNEAQVILHNHPANAGRIARGLPPVNSLWLWGGGRLPASVTSVASRVLAPDAELRALATLAGIPCDSGDDARCSVLDLRRERGWLDIEQTHLLSVPPRTVLVLDFADGMQFRISRRQAWRWWRRPLGALT